MLWLQTLMTDSLTKTWFMVDEGDDAAVLTVNAAASPPPPLALLPLLKQQWVELGILELLPLGAATQKRTATRSTMTTGRTMRQMVSSLRPAAPFKVWTVVDDASTKSGKKIVF